MINYIILHHSKNFYSILIYNRKRLYIFFGFVKKERLGVELHNNSQLFGLD